MLTKLIAITLLMLASLLVASCGIPQEEYDALLEERNVAAAELESVKVELATTKDNLASTESDLVRVEGDLANTESELTTLRSEAASIQADLVRIGNDLEGAIARLDRMEQIFGQLLFFDDFDDRPVEVLEGWNFGDGWSIIEGEESNVLQGIGHVHASIRPSYDWIDFILETKIKLLGDNGIHINLRAIPSLEERYILRVFAKGIHLSKSPSYRVIASSRYSLRRERWYDLRIEVIGGSIKVYVDSDLKLDYTDNEPLETRGINLELLDDSGIYFDDVLVTAPVDIS
jgi:hypothetical protein